MSFFLNMWKSTRLKMLPIYGLSCRLNILASSSDDEQQKLHYYQASDFNSQTSHEDLGIGFDAISHGKLYDDFAYSLVKSDEWKISKFDIQEAKEFEKWIYESMLLKPIPYALCINMFSEFYNHAEYGYAYETFKRSMKNFYNIQGKELEKALLYIDVHNEYQTEIHHFLAVINSLENYEKASGEMDDYVKFVASHTNAKAIISNKFQGDINDTLVIKFELKTEFEPTYNSLEIENAATNLKHIKDIAAFCMYVNEFSKEVCLAVVLDDKNINKESFSTDLLKFFQKYFNLEKTNKFVALVPTRVYFVENIPKTKLGKIKRDDLVAMFEKVKES